MYICMYVHEYIVADAFRSKKSSSALLLHEQQERINNSKNSKNMNVSATVCSWTAPCHSTYCLPLFYTFGYYYVQATALLKVKDI